MIGDLRCNVDAISKVGTDSVKEILGERKKIKLFKLQGDILKGLLGCAVSLI